MARLFTVLSFLLTVALIGGVIASSVIAVESQKTVEDVKILAGTWKGYAVLYPEGTKADVTIYAKEDGSYKAYGRSSMVVGRFILSGEKLLFQSSRSSGSVTLHEEKGQQTLKLWLENGELSGEYDRVK